MNKLTEINEQPDEKLAFDDKNIELKPIHFPIVCLDVSISMHSRLSRKNKFPSRCMQGYLEKNTSSS